MEGVEFFLYLWQKRRWPKIKSKPDKPYYLRQPWDVLFKESKLEEVSPWGVDLVYLLNSLLEEMDKAGIDFRIAGTAILSSVLIYHKKADLLLKMEKPPSQKEEEKEVYLPPPVPLPFRFELTTTSIHDLIGALEKALEEESKKIDKPKLPTLPVPIPEIIDLEEYLLEVEVKADNLLEKIRMNYSIGESFDFRVLIKEKGWSEIIQIFMMTLFLAQRMKIDLQQDNDTNEITVILLEENTYEF